MTETFKAGDVVELKSGSPKMTISATSADGKVWCNWFDITTNQLRADVIIHTIILKHSS